MSWESLNPWAEGIRVLDRLPFCFMKGVVLWGLGNTELPLTFPSTSLPSLRGASLCPVGCYLQFRLFPWEM